MRISWSEDYAVIFMSKLADNYQKRLIPLSEIAEEFKISLPFLKQLARTLKKNGLIESKEGITGGYKLSRSPENITLWNVLASFNKNSLTPCCNNDGKHTLSCPKEDFCKTKTTWQKINQEFLLKLNSVTLNQL